MAVTTAKTLVLRGATVLQDGTRFSTLGCNGTAAREPAHLVSMRHLSSCCHYPLATADQPAEQAGRPGSPAGGVLSRRRPAIEAGGTIPNGWSLSAISTVLSARNKREFLKPGIVARANHEIDRAWAVHAN
jgi:hypothetical protein